MATYNLNLNSSDFAKEVLSYYIWGQDTQPPVSKIANSKWIGRKDEITLRIDLNLFLYEVRNAVNAKDFKLFEVFFSGKTKGENILNKNNSNILKLVGNEYFLTQKQFANMFYIDADSDSYITASDPEKHPSSISLYNRNIDNPNFAKLAFVFGSLRVGLDTKNIRYVLDKDLKPLRVENVSFVFSRIDNFDLEGGEGSERVNHILKQIADPSGIGKKVILEFLGNNKVSVGTISKKDYQNMKSLEADELQLRDFLKGTYGVIAKTAGVALLEKLLFLLEFNRIRSSGVIDYLDEKGRVVIFGSDQNDNFINAKAKNLDLSSDVDIKDLPDFLITYIANLNHYKKHLHKGIVYVGGKGYNVYNVDDKSVIVDDAGNGEVNFAGVRLTGGKYDKDKDVYVGNFKETYKLADKNAKTTTLKVTSKEGKSIEIRNFDKMVNNGDRKFLGIGLCCNNISYLSPYNFGYVSLGFGFLDRDIPQYEFRTSGQLSFYYYGSTWQVLNVPPFGSNFVSYDENLPTYPRHIYGHWHIYPKEEDCFISTDVYDFSTYFSVISSYLSLHPSNSRIIVKSSGVGFSDVLVTQYSLSDFLVFLQSILASAYSDCNNLLSHNLHSCSIKHSFEILSEKFIEATIQNNPSVGQPHYHFTA